MIQTSLCHSNVLILLDDVDDLKQLEALAGSHKWFGDGSRIIITTRDEHMLRTRKVDHIYPVTLLSQDEGIQLYRKYAYNKEEPLKDYGIFSLRVVSYVDGLPLALKWNNSIPIKINIHSWRLNNNRLPTRINLDARGIDLHSVRCPICDEDVETPQHLFIDCIVASQLWSMVANWHVLTRLSKPRYRLFGGSEIRFASMQNLQGRTLLSEVPTSLSNELRYIKWDYYPASRFPDSFQPMNLGVLKMENDLQTELWKGWKHLPFLKVLELIWMKNLVSTPDFDGLPSLQKLTIDECDELE
ncbi:Toll/interleukin-1 receptor domain-containing protein [Tanacetum coccineum]